MYLLILFTSIIASTMSETIENCTSTPVPFDIPTWIMSLPTDTSSWLVGDMISKPEDYHEEKATLCKALDFMYTNLSDTSILSTDAYYLSYMNHYPIISRKIACGMLPSGKQIIDYKTINYPLLYSTLSVLNPAISQTVPVTQLAAPMTLTKERRTLVYSTVLKFLQTYLESDTKYDSFLYGLPSYINAIFKAVRSGAKIFGITVGDCRLAAKSHCLDDDDLHCFYSG